MASYMGRQWWHNILHAICSKSNLMKAMKFGVASALRALHFWLTRPHQITITSEKTDSSNALEDFEIEVQDSLSPPRSLRDVMEMSGLFVDAYRERLKDSSISMLPSHVYNLPTGCETGSIIALDIGGSTLRIALVCLAGKGKESGDDLKGVQGTRSFLINESVRALEGMVFFEWLAARVQETLTQSKFEISRSLYNVALAWSFPIQQTSTCTASLLPMGKGFCAPHGLLGEELGGLVMRACESRGINIRIQAIVNDGDATLLSHAYLNPTTRMSLIFGTGTNAAVFLPTASLARHKFGHRRQLNGSAASHVVVNTEMSMVGKKILPTSKWDEQLNTAHKSPDYQPLEYLTSGRYLGEIVRLIIVDAVERADLFDGCMPWRLKEPYSLDTSVIASFEKDLSPSLSVAKKVFLEMHPMETVPQLSELKFVRVVSMLVSRRAATYLAVALHALWVLRTTSEGLDTATSAKVAIACSGAMIEQYPHFRQQCQQYLNEMCEFSGASAGTISLELAPGATLFGTAVAACIVSESIQN